MVALPPPEQKTVAAIMAGIEAREGARPQYHGYGISASSLGIPCDRKLWLDLRWASQSEQPRAKTLRIFARGNDAERRMIDDLRAGGLDVAEVDPDTGTQWRFSLANGWIRGKADGRCTGVIEAPKADHVIEIKCIKAAKWRGIKKHGLRKHAPDHWHQLHAGMAGLGADRGLYIAENADTCEILTERIRLDHEEIARQIARVDRALSDDAPPMGMMAEATTEIKTGKIKSSPPCLFCDHAGFCFENALALRSCRTCLHFTFTSDGDGHCARFGKNMRPAEQQAGSECPAHLFLPALIHGDQIDADPKNETITYAMKDGSEWTDGAANEVAQ